MPTIANLADFRDPNDPQGRSYRQVNAARSHAIPIGTLVELENGARLFVAQLTRDCDQEPLYSLTSDLDDDDPIAQMKWSHGHGEDGLSVVRKPER